MSMVEIILVLIVMAIAAADIVVRLYVAPKRKDQLVEDLLDVLHEPDDVPSLDAARARAISGNLMESLLRHFMQSTLSRQIVESLATRQAGLCEREVVDRLVERLEGEGAKALPLAAIRKVLTILMGSDLVVMSHGAIRLTAAGQDLYNVLHDRRADVPASVKGER